MEMMGSPLGVNLYVDYLSSAFDPIIEMVRLANAPATKEKMADVEGSASSPTETKAALEPIMVADEAKVEEGQVDPDPTFKTLTKEALISEVVTLNYCPTRDITYVVSDGEK
ncbi:hypothetical protein L3X38_043181 [Prunus dulcis]|uniref:Uncharacterized protein n=1 Tax=Prunus dulcis TaxID=3755 RepID=A0AAD4YM02_PRUDU|nr:hypothetical protein L3X38_043181 [Prunus dulcis]